MSDQYLFRAPIFIFQIIFDYFSKRHEKMTLINSPLRWYLKKISRKSFILGTRSVRFLKKSCTRDMVRVLTYHRFGNRSYDPFCLDISLFKEQMYLLKASDKVVSYSDFVEFLKGDLSITQSAVLVTIDDGYFSIYKDAFSVIVEHRIPAIVFVSPGEMDNRSTSYSKGEPERKMTWSELRELSDAGVTIGSHGWSHRSMARISPMEAREEAYRSHKLLEDVLNRSISSFAYPYGTCNDYNKTTSLILEKCGYTCAFTAMHGACLPGQNPFTIPRVQMESGEGIELFKLIIQGGLDSWRLVDKYLWRLKNNRGCS